MESHLPHLFFNFLRDEKQTYGFQPKWGTCDKKQERQIVNI